MASDPEDNQMDIFSAAREGEREVVKRLLEQGADVEHQNDEGDTLLILAAQYGHVPLIKLLLDNGADVSKVATRDDASPLHAAAVHGYSDALRILLDHGADIQAKTSSDNTALFTTAIYGHLDATQLLLERGAEIEAPNQSQETALTAAAWWGHLEVVKLLVERGCDLESHDKFGNTAINGASFHGHFDVVKFLFEKGVCLQPNSEKVPSPLYYAAGYGHFDIVKLLCSRIDLASNTPVCPKGDTPLHFAARNGYSKIVDYLLQKGVDPSYRNKAGETAIYDAIDSGRRTIVKLLLEKCPDIDIRNKNYCPPLVRACSKGREGIVALLLPKSSNLKGDLGACLRQAALNGSKAVVQMLFDEIAKIRLDFIYKKNALICAAECGHFEVVKLILERAPDTGGKEYIEAALLRAAQFGYTEVVKLLLERGASSKATNKQGWTALNLASYAGQLDVVKELVADCSDTLHLASATRGLIPIHYAAEKGHLEVLQYLLAQYTRKAASSERKAPADSKTTTMRNSESKKYFDKNRSAVNLKTKVGWTLLHCAAFGGRLEVVKYLLDNKADQRILDSSGRSPLALASWCGHVEIVELLLKTPGSNPTLSDNAGRTALFLAAAWGQCEVIKTLLAFPAIKKQVLKKDAYNSTPISVALRRRNEKAVVQLLEVTRPSLDSQDFKGKSLGEWVRLLASSPLKDIFLDCKWGESSLEERTDTEDGDCTDEEDGQTGDSGPSGREVDCDVCLIQIPKGAPRYQCGICDRYSFVECKDCFDFGLKCPYQSHNLIFGEDEGEEGWTVLDT